MWCISEKIGKNNGKTCKKYYRINFSFPDNGVIPSRLNRKRIKFNNRIKYSNNKFIESIEYYGEEEAKCIMVDNPEHLYGTDDYISTTTAVNSNTNYTISIVFKIKSFTSFKITQISCAGLFISIMYF
jgi:hypothetical protein